MVEWVIIGDKLRNSNGHWNVPYLNWTGTKWNRNANRLDNDWNSNYRVVLLVTLFRFPAKNQSVFSGVSLGSSLFGWFGDRNFLTLIFPAIKHSAHFFYFYR